MVAQDARYIGLRRVERALRRPADPPPTGSSASALCAPPFSASGNLPSNDRGGNPIMKTNHRMTKLTIAGTTALATILFVPSFSSHGGAVGVTPCFAQSGGGAGVNVGVGVGVNGAGTSTGAKTGVNGNVSGDPGLTGNTSGDAGLKGNTSGDPGLTGNTHSSVNSQGQVGLGGNAGAGGGFGTGGH
ncbi:MAG: hypothetical protein ACRED6_10460 [Stellaceae bacterium]